MGLCGTRRGQGCQDTRAMALRDVLSVHQRNTRTHTHTDCWWELLHTVGWLWMTLVLGPVCSQSPECQHGRCLDAMSWDGHWVLQVCVFTMLTPHADQTNSSCCLLQKVLPICALYFVTPVVGYARYATAAGVSLTWRYTGYIDVHCSEYHWSPTRHAEKTQWRPSEADMQGLH